MAFKTLLLFALNLPPFARTMSSNQTKLLLTNPGNIFLTEYNASSETITQLLRQPVSGVPSWAAFNPGFDTLYAVDESSSTIRSFTVNLDQNTISPVSTAQGSSGVVHLAFNKDHSRMVAASYGSGKVDVWNTEAGGLKLMKTLVSDDPLGPNTSRQSSAHPHQAVLDPSGRFFAINDLGTGHILLLDSLNDRWEVVNHVPVRPRGLGPRHGAFYPADAERASHYMVACELESTINVFELEYTEDSIDFEQIQTTPSHCPGRGPATPETAAAGELVIRGDDVYVSNRLTGNATGDSIAHFQVVRNQSNQRITGVTCRDDVPSGGVLPRMFSMSQNGQRLFVANQAGEAGLVVLPLMQDGGTLGQPVASVPIQVYGSQPTTGPQFVQQIP